MILCDVGKYGADEYSDPNKLWAVYRLSNFFRSCYRTSGRVLMPNSSMLMRC
jgi:hypothetical protein